MSDRNKTQGGDGNRGKHGRRGVPFDDCDDAVPKAAFRKKRQLSGADREAPFVPIDSEPVPDIFEVESEVRLLSKKMGTRFLSEEEKEGFLSGVGELRHVESVIHNSNEDGRVARKNGKKKSPVWEPKLNALKQERKTLVESLKERERAIRSTLEQALSGVQSELGRLKGLPGFETDPKYPEHLADLKGIEDAIGALDDFIRKRGKQRGGANKKRSESNNPVTPGDARNPDCPNPDNRDVTPEPIPEKNPVPDDRVGKKENVMDRSLLETSIRSIESRLKDLGTERLEAEESLGRVSAYPEHMKRLKASLGFFLRSNEEIFGKLRAEEAVFQKRLEVLDEGIRREEQALSILREQLEAMDATVTPAAEPVIRTPAASTKEATPVPKVDVPRGVAEKEREAVTVDMSVDVSRRFYEQFKINKSDLLLLEGFSDLKEEQQLFVFENLRQIAVGRIGEESESVVREQEAATKARVGETLGGGKIGKVGEGLFGGLWNYVSRNYREAKSEKTSAEQVMTGGMDVHGDVLRQLVEGMKEQDLQVVDRDGVLEVQFLRGALQGLSPEADGSIGKFNEVANRFARIPGEWALTSVSKKQHAEYRQAKKAYDEALAEVRNELAGSGNPEHMALLLDAEGKVAMSRFLQTNPDVEQYLGSMRNRSVILEVVKRTATVENGLSFALGFARRSLLTGALVSGAVASAPVTAATGALWAATAALSGFRSAKREKEDLKKRDRSALRGAEDGKKGARNVVSADILSGKLRSLTQKVEALASEGATSGAVPVEELKRLQARIAYTKRKAEEGLIDFSSEERDENGEVIGRIAVTNLATKYEFIKEVSLAEGVIAAHLKQKGPMDGSADVQLPALSAEDAGSGPNPGFEADYDRLAERLTGYLDVREQRIDRERAAQVARKAVLGVSISSGFVIGGSALRSFLDGSAEPGLGQAIETGKSWMKKVLFGGVDDNHRMGGGGGQADVPGTGHVEADADAVRESVKDIAERSASERVMPSDAGSLKDMIHGEGGGSGRGAGEMAKESLSSAGPSGPKGDATIPGQEAVKSMAVDQAAGKGAKVVETASGSFEVKAETGDSVTTLARRALAEYVRENNLSGLTPEQKVFIEDYLQKKVARGGTLRVGEKIEFTKDFLNEALGRAKVLDTDQLQNLHRYVEQVGEFRTGSPSAQVIPMESGGDVLSAGNASEIPSSEPGLSDRVPKVSSVPAMAEDAAALTKGGPPAATAEKATETGNQVGALRNTVESNAARDFLADPNHVEPFRKAAAGTVRELFSTSAGEVNEKLFLKAGKMTSKVVFRDCLLAVADPEKMAFIDGFDVKGVRRLGKFLIAARRAGIHPEIGIGKTETFRVYIERVSVRLAERNMDPSELIASVSDRDLDGFSGSALEVWRNQGT